MAASNRHWPSLFKSKPHQQWQNDSHSNRSPSGCEERAPEPKPRWNPLPEQVRILEAIFHSGMVNPPRDEIRRIRAQLQEYGQVGDANVFYWFQNRKSRSKSKKPHVGQTNSKLSHSQQQPKRKSPLSSTTTTSSSERSSQNSADKTLSLGSFNISSPTASVNQPFLQARGEFLAAPFLFPPVQQPTPAPPPPPPAPASFGSQGFCFPDPPATGSVPSSSSLFLGDLLLMNHAPTKKAMGADVRTRKVQQPFPNFGMNPVPSAFQTVSHGISSFDHLQGNRFFGLSEMAPMKSTVFINDVAFEVGSAGFNVREAFGEDAILLHPSGQPVLTSEWGHTLFPLQHGASYYLMRTLSSAPNGTAVRNLI